MQAGRRGRHCLIASSMNTWWKCSHSSIRSTSWIRLRHTRSCSFPQSGIVYRVQVGLLAGHRAEAIKSGVSLTAARSHAPCGQSVVLLKTKEAARQVLETEIFCYRYLKITLLSNNIFSWNFAFLSQIHSKTSALNFIRIYSDLAFLSHIV